MAAREATPPPVIGKAGNLTVFITPSPKSKPNPTLSPSPSPSPKLSQNLSPSHKSNLSPCPSPVKEEKASSPPAAVKLPPVESPPVKLPPIKVRPPPVQVPPVQYEKGKEVNSHGSAFGFFWDAVARVQEAHSSLDEYLANWFGLDQSKYQWALNDFYENNGKEKECNKGSKPEILSKGGQTV